MKYSLRKFLLFSILFTMLVIGGATIGGGYRASVHEVEELFDAQLSRSARLMLGLVLAEVNLGHVKEFTENVQENILALSDRMNIEDEISQHGHFYELKLAYQVWDSYGNMLLRSANAPLQPMSDLQQGYANQFFSQQHWRTFSLWDSKQRYLVIAAERDDVRTELVDKITFQMTWPFILLVPLLGLFVWYFVGRGLKPLEQIANEIGSRKTEYLEPLKTQQAPVEIKPLVDELNRLFESLAHAFDKEKRFTSDAAHELRTPLSALKVHLQVLENSETAEDKQRQLEAIHQGVDRAGHLVDQLLGLARLEPQAIRAVQKLESIDLHALCVDVMSEIYPLAREKNQEISLSGDEKLSVQGYPYPLQSMLTNLLSNSVTYTPEGGEIQLEIKQDLKTVNIWVHDSGPGIPESSRQSVLSRFKKVEGRIQSGSGIGLSIVKRVADLHGMQLELLSSDRLGGLCVHVWGEV